MAKIILHLHLYQPPRENPWTDQVDPEPPAAPLANWNERISAECYEPSIKSLAHVSWNVAPTLFRWIHKYRPHAYAGILEADRKSRELYQGHGSALAHPFHHAILPLLSAGDRDTEIFWGRRDFELRFGRSPEGLWLPETAVDMATLSAACEAGIHFVILAPSQALRVRRLPDSPWQDVTCETLDTTCSYVCSLPSGKSLAVFFYNGSLAHEIAFGRLAESGERFWERIRRGLGNLGETQLLHAATDGETYGHHTKEGADSLFSVLSKFQKTASTPLTNYGAYLEKFPPAYEVEIRENSSWSCAHGIERWRSDCGCRVTGGSQSWRGPLRQALEWLAGEINQVYQQKASRYFKDPWLARRDYIDLLCDPSWGVREKFWDGHQSYFMDEIGRRQSLKFLEMQRFRMAMFTSCGWFFDDIAGLEARLVLRLAARALEMAKDFGANVEEGFVARLAEAKSNDPEAGDGATIYRQILQAKAAVPKAL